MLFKLYIKKNNNNKIHKNINFHLDKSTKTEKITKLMQHNPHDFQVHYYHHNFNRHRHFISQTGQKN